MASSKKKKTPEKKSTEEMSDSERIERGQLLVRTIIEMAGKPKEHLESTLKGYVKNIEGNFKVLKRKYAKPKKVEDDIYSTYVEIELWFLSPSDVIGFGFDFMPSSIEILEPNSLTYSSAQFTNMLNDMQAKLYKVDTEYKRLKKEHSILNQNLGNTVRNLILLAVATGKKEPKEISLITGIPEENLQGLIDLLIKEERLVKKGDRYELTPPK